MTRLRSIFLAALCLLWLGPALLAQEREEGDLEIVGLTDQSWAEYYYNLTNNVAYGHSGAMVRYEGAVLTADEISLNEQTKEVTADGGVRLEHEDQIWVGQHAVYNFETRQMQASQFRFGKPPVFMEGHDLTGGSNAVYVATNAYVTTDDIADPVFRVRAKEIRIIGRKKLVARNAYLYVKNMPVFYYPYYSRNLGPHANNFNFLPGYRSIFGPYLLTSYTWWLNPQLDGILHVDERERRGPGAGPTLNYHLGRWGEGTFKYYYQYDQNPTISATNGIPNNRQRIDFSYLSSPATNLEFRAVARYQGDSNMVREFFESEYRHDPQPDSYFEANKFWQNFSLDEYTQPRANDFLDTVERLPEVRLTGFRQEIGSLPLYYESQSSVGYYRRLFIETNDVPNGTNYAAARADTFHQMLMPLTFFDWLNVTPRVGGRFTGYSEASGPGAYSDEESRGVFNTGVEVSFRASRLWPEVENNFLQVDGLRHIIEPSVNYSFVPKPNVTPNQLPQFDYEMPSLRLLPLDFPEYNAVDSIDSENVLRWGVRNKLQTKRDGQVVNLVNWDVYADWRLQRRDDQGTFSDVYSDLTLRPRSWLTVESVTRYDMEDGLWRMAFHEITLQPVSALSWSIGQYYLRNDLSSAPTALGIGNNLFTSVLTYKINENWGLRTVHRFEASNGSMEEQAYTVYRDLRSWTAALTLRVLQNPTGPQDLTVAFTFSLKAHPHFGLGSDTGLPYSLIGG
jgi:lipopolysaccharide assembly outer membrane protein LptD (OstA)